MAPARRPAVYHEGPEAAERFTGLMRRVLSVPKEELARREAAYQKTRSTPARSKGKKR